LLKIPYDIVNFFFEEIHKKGRYTIEIIGTKAKIIPIDYQAYYKPIIVVKDIDTLKISLIKFVECLNTFYKDKNVLKEYHDLSFFFNNLLFNMNSTDALDLSSYIDKRCQFFQNDCFKEFDQITPIANFNDNLICVERVIEEPGLETPFILEFTIEIDNKIYQLPLVRFAIDNDNVCHLFAVQYGRYRDFGVQDCEYKKEVNKINKGVKKYRNVPPSFVLSLRLFLDLLKSYNIDQIVIPDFLFSRYKNYYKASTTGRSDDILSRILEDFLNLMQRMEYQFDDVEIEYYPNEIDGFTHISLNNEKKKKLSNK